LLPWDDESHEMHCFHSDDPADAEWCVEQTIEEPADSTDRLGSETMELVVLNDPEWSSLPDVCW
jgi:hypothetical protein